MALEGTYEYECMRAELLGVAKPDYADFIKKKTETEAEERAIMEAEALREAQAQHEQFQQAGGRFDELNNILKSTQKKLNSFTAPFSQFIKAKIGMTADKRPDQSGSEATFPADNSEFEEVNLNARSPVYGKGARADPLSVMDNLIDKCDLAQGSMEHQNKQMKRFLN